MDPMTLLWLVMMGAGYKGGEAAGWWGGGPDKGPHSESDIAGALPQWFQNPEYGEATEARGKWGEKLKEWEDQPGYGAIAPNWGEIWERAKKKTSHYFWGGPGGEPGLSSKVRASAARRGVSDSPALETELARMGGKESDLLQDIGVRQATKEAEFGELGRQNWMNQLMRLSQQKPSGMWKSPSFSMPSRGGADTSGADMGGMIGNMLQLMMSQQSEGTDITGGGEGGYMADFEKMFAGKMPKTAQKSIKGRPGSAINYYL